MHYEKPEIRTLDAASILDSIGPASAFASGSEQISDPLSSGLSSLPGPGNNVTFGKK